MIVKADGIALESRFRRWVLRATRPGSWSFWGDT